MIDPRDRRPQNHGKGPETYISLTDGSILGLYIRGVPGQVILGIREDRHGQPVSCAVANTVYVNHPRLTS